jgi:hypothetical protein
MNGEEKEIIFIQIAFVLPKVQNGFLSPLKMHREWTDWSSD